MSKTLRQKWFMISLMFLAALILGILGLLPGYLRAVGVIEPESPYDDPDFDPRTVPIFTEIPKGEPFDIEYHDASALQIVADLRRRTGIKIRFEGEPPRGRTSFKLRNVTWAQVLQVAMEPIGYSFVQRDDVIVIQRFEKFADESDLVAQAFVVRSDPEAIAPQLLPLVDSALGGRIYIDEARNALVVVERPSRTSDIAQIIKQLDAEAFVRVPPEEPSRGS